MSLPSVTVIVTTCDYAVFLEECLRSLDAQTLPPARVVIVDDASTDDTPGELGRVVPTLTIQKRVVVHRNDRRLGLAASLNLAIRRLTPTELFAHVDADDTVTPRYLEAMAQALAEHPEAAYAYPRMRLTGTEHGRYASHDFDGARLVFEGNYIPNIGLMRRSAVLSAGGYRDMATHLDWDLWLSLLDIGLEGVLVDEVLYNWRRHDGAMTYQPLRRRLAIRFVMLWRHRRSVRRHARAGIPWTWRALRRTVGRGSDGAIRSASGWVEPPEPQRSKQKRPRA